MLDIIGHPHFIVKTQGSRGVLIHGMILLTGEQLIDAKVKQSDRLLNKSMQQHIFINPCTARLITQIRNYTV